MPGLTSHAHRNDSAAVWVRHQIWHAQANSKGIVLTSRGRSRPTILVPGVKEGQVKERMESLTGQFQFRRLPGEPEPFKIVGELEGGAKVRAEVAEMVLNDRILMDLVFGGGTYVGTMFDANCIHELAILDLAQKLILKDENEKGVGL